MTARVSILLKSRASLTCFRACLLPGRAKDLSAPLTSYVTNSAAVGEPPLGSVVPTNKMEDAQLIS